MFDAVKKVAGQVLFYTPKSVQTYVKEQAEIAYWRKVLKESNGVFFNGHFESRYTDLFGLEKAHFDGKRMLDIGCGPLGSLEWADNAIEVVGADPLADQYNKLNKNLKRMTFVKGGCESLPFADEAFDVVSIFNALDHVEDVDSSISETVRVMAAGGDLLLIVEIDHKATITEPHDLSEDILDTFEGCSVISKKIYAIRDDHDVYASLREAKPRSKPGDEAILCAHLRKA